MLEVVWLSSGGEWDWLIAFLGVGVAIAWAS